MTKECWNCKKDIPPGFDNCPSCGSVVSEKIVSGMETVSETSTKQTPITLGTIISNRYKIERLLGQGGMGKVFLAEDQVMGNKIAIKLVPPELSYDPVAIKDLQREVQICHT